MKTATPTLPTKLAYWIDHRLNILFRGKHGVGKTGIVQEAFGSVGIRKKTVIAEAGFAVDWS